MPHHLEFEQLFRYDRSNDGIVLRVALEFGGEQCDFDATVDTGATYCVFARAHGELLGLEIERGLEQRFGTALGIITAYGHEVYLNGVGFRLESYVFFASDPGMSKNVLGRRGWLDMLRVGIVDYDGELYLSRYQTV